MDGCVCVCVGNGWVGNGWVGNGWVMGVGNGCVRVCVCVWVMCVCVWVMGVCGWVCVCVGG